MAPRFPSVTHTQDITCALRDGACPAPTAASEPHSRWSNHRASAATIQSSKKNIPTISTPPLNSNHHLVDLNFSTASSTRSSSLNTATISGLDFPVFTTDSQSTWLPNSTPSLPAKSEHNHQNDNLPQDFVLFDNSPASPAPNRPQQLSSHRRHSAHIPANLTPQSQQPSASAVQNQRVTQIIQAIGHHQLPSSVNSNKRFSNQFYASSAPSSTVSLNQHSRLRRPPVPLFNQSTGQVQTAKMMNAADVDLDDFIPFEGGVNTAFSSPAIPTAFDFGGSAHSSTSNLGTVSPHDLLVNEPYMSAPNSAALTSLTSPSINESPDFDAFDVSPNFGSADFDGPPIDSWYSLFPNDSGSEKPVDNSPALRSEDLEPERPASNRKKSGGSPTSGARHSSVAGVAPRKRDKPLPPIIVEDPNDTIAMKRARNTLAARKSRERKALRFDELEERIAKLEAERDHWKKIALSQSGPQ